MQNSGNRQQETVRLAGLSAVRAGSGAPDPAARQLPLEAWLGSIPEMLALGGTRDIQAHKRAMTGINASGHLTPKIERRQPAWISQNGRALFEESNESCCFGAELLAGNNRCHDGHQEGGLGIRGHEQL